MLEKPRMADEDPAIIRTRIDVFPPGCAVLEEVDVRRSTVTFLGYLTAEKWPALREPVLDEDPATTHDPSGTVLNITTLAVSPLHQKQQHGKQILDYAIAVARREGCTHIVLETARAKAWYLRHGFTVYSERAQRGIPLTVMQLALVDLL